MSGPYRYRYWRPYALAALTLRALSRLLGYWWLIVLMVLAAVPVGPHLRVDPLIGRQNCTYLGGKGLVAAAWFSGCPALVMLDGRTGRLWKG